MLELLRRLWQWRENPVLFLSVLLIAFTVGFLIGVALWEPDVPPPAGGSSEPGPRLSSR
jgi:hypothetical protein